MCLDPISVVNPSKYVNLKYRDRFINYVPCCKCVECMQSNSAEWYMRALQECKDISSSSDGAFVYFDYLSYAPKHLPTMDQVYYGLPNIECFRSSDIRGFLQRLDRDIQRHYNARFRYFISSEYGKEEYTHRPHYHLLAFVYGDISSDDFSRLVSKHWYFGRTDGVDYRGSYYNEVHNTIKAKSSDANFLRVCSYVTKYVEKSCLFSSKLDKVVDDAMSDIDSYFGDSNLDGVGLDWYKLRLVRMSLRRQVNMFHRQSQNFGASLLADVDIDKLFKDGCLWVDSYKLVKIPVKLPTYFKRKLFYDLIEIDGTRTWQLNDLGLDYVNYRSRVLVDRLTVRFGDYIKSFGIKTDITPYKLADYVVNYRGRLNGYLDPVPLGDRDYLCDLFNYVTVVDRYLFLRGLTSDWCGNSTIGYSDCSCSVYGLSGFIRKYVIYWKDYEDLLHLFSVYLAPYNEMKKVDYERKQRLRALYKSFRKSLVN